MVCLTINRTCDAWTRNPLESLSLLRVWGRRRLKFFHFNWHWFWAGLWRPQRPWDSWWPSRIFISWIPHKAICSNLREVKTQIRCSNCLRCQATNLAPIIWGSPCYCLLRLDILQKPLPDKWWLHSQLQLQQRMHYSETILHLGTLLQDSYGEQPLHIYPHERFKCKRKQRLWPWTLAMETMSWPSYTTNVKFKISESRGIGVTTTDWLRSLKLLPMHWACPQTWQAITFTCVINTVSIAQWIEAVPLSWRNILCPASGLNFGGSRKGAQN